MEVIIFIVRFNGLDKKSFWKSKEILSGLVKNRVLTKVDIEFLYFRRRCIEGMRVFNYY